MVLICRRILVTWDKKWFHASFVTLCLEVRQKCLYMLLLAKKVSKILSLLQKNLQSRVMLLKANPMGHLSHYYSSQQTEKPRLNFIFLVTPTKSPREKKKKQKSDCTTLWYESYRTDHIACPKSIKTGQTDSKNTCHTEHETELKC